MLARLARGLTVLALGPLLLLAAGTAVAGAQTQDTSYPTVSTLPVTTDPGSGGTSAVGGVSAARSSLPFSGGDVALLTILGLAAVGSGVAIVVFARRRSTSTA
jgi:hypothetical protein